MTVTILTGDVLDKLAELPANHFDCVVTSPPYWGLRDYGVDGQIGLEPTLGEHIAKMVEVFAAVHRVLKPTGTLWLNYGDCYATSPNGRSAADTKAAGIDDRTFRDKPFSTVQGVLKPKDLCMVPNRLAIALQEWGWWVRSEIIWGKSNPMPDSSGRYRPSTSHEKIFMLVKSKTYFYDSEAVRQKTADTTAGRLGQNIDGQVGSFRANGGAKINGPMRAVGDAETRLLRNFEPAPVEVWPIATQSFSDAHFATFPPKLVERCLLAGCPAGGTVLDPFGGAGTTGMVADRMQLDCTLIELNPEYVEIAQNRISGDRGALLDFMEAGDAA